MAPDGAAGVCGAPRPIILWGAAAAPSPTDVMPVRCGGLRVPRHRAASSAPLRGPGAPGLVRRSARGSEWVARDWQCPAGAWG